MPVCQYTVFRNVHLQGRAEALPVPSPIQPRLPPGHQAPSGGAPKHLRQGPGDPKGPRPRFDGHRGRQRHFSVAVYRGEGEMWKLCR